MSGIVNIAICLLLILLISEPGVLAKSEQWERVSSSAQFRRRPLRRPMFRTSSQVLKARLGDTVNFQCNVAFLGSRVITWHNESSGRVLFAGPVNVIGDSRLDVDAGSHTFTLNNVTNMDAGDYRCQVELVDKPIFLKHTLVVLVPPSITAMPQDGKIVVRAGTTVHLSCTTNGSPMPDVTWRRLIDAEGKRVSDDDILGQGTQLVLPDIDYVDAGLYVCRADNGVGLPAEDRIELKVIYRPRVTAVESKVYASPGQDDVRLQCRMRGEPRPSLQWRHASNGQRPTSNPEARLHSFEQRDEDGDVGVLRIDRLNEKDYGKYVCKAVNSEGFDEDSIELTGEPERPVIVSGRESSERTSYTLRWTVRSPYKIIRQRVNYWQDGPIDVDGQNDGHEVVVDDERHLLQLSTLISEQSMLEADTEQYVFEVLIPELKPDRVYVAQVQATNAFRDGDWSDHFFFETTGRGSGQRSVHGQSGWTSSGSRGSLTAFLVVNSMIVVLIGGHNNVC